MCAAEPYAGGGDPTFYLDYKIGDVPVVDPTKPSNLIKFAYIDSINTNVERHYVRVLDQRFDVIERVILGGKVDIAYKFGTGGGTVSESRKARVSMYESAFQVKGNVLDIFGTDLSLMANRGVKNRAFVKKTISEMVEQIAQENNFTPIVEPTDGTFTFRQTWISDIAFIQQVVLRKALSKNTGSGNFNFYFQNGNELHFHTPTFTERGRKIARRYDLGAPSGVLAFRLRYNGEMVNALGGLSIGVTGYDPEQKSTIPIPMNDTEAGYVPLMADKAFDLALPKGTEFGRYYAVPFHSKEEVTGWAKKRWHTSTRGRYVGRMVVVGDPLIRAGDLISIRVPSIRGVHPHSGTYLVESCVHTCSSRRMFVTKILMSRSGSMRGVDTLPGDSSPVSSTSSPIRSTVSISVTAKSQ